MCAFVHAGSRPTPAAFSAIPNLLSKFIANTAARLADS
jgi:hypothetical protein